MESKPKKQKIFSLAQGKNEVTGWGLHKTTERAKKTSIKSISYKSKCTLKRTFLYGQAYILKISSNFNVLQVVS